jgi:hypothetical protein
MSLKTFALSVVIAGTLGIGAAVAQTIQLTGTVTAVTRTQITLRSGSEIWTIARTGATSVTGALTVGASVTVQCAAPDAHKNEAPTTGPSATPASS